MEAGFQDFKAHSTKGASVPAAYSQGMSVADIINIVDWSSDNTLKRFYYKPIIAKQMFPLLINARRMRTRVTVLSLCVCVSAVYQLL